MTVMNSTEKELNSLFAARKKMYQFLHLLFLEPVDETALVFLRDQSNLHELARIHEGGKILNDYLENLSEINIQHDREEYQRLFTGPGYLAAPPWESFYRSKEQLLFEEWTIQVREQYHRYGLSYIRENKEPDDHLLLELEFMIFLANECLDNSSLQELLSDQISFLKDHLMMWILTFSRRIIENSSSPLYIGAALLLADFISFDLETLLEIKEAMVDER